MTERDHSVGRSRARPLALAHVEAWLFDLDNTLYPASCNLFAQVDRRIGSYIAETFNLDATAARALQKRYFREYGTTLRGLMLEHGAEPVAFLDYVHDIEYDPVTADAALDAALGRLDGRKLIFTNGSTRHAERVMERLGVRRHFEAVFDIAAASFLPKPEPEAYRALLARYGIDPAKAAMIDDIPRNLVPAAALGMTTVWLASDSEYAKDGAEGDHIHHRADRIAVFLEAVLAAREAEKERASG
jgi:putative hydrolase of the HAD superfamily